MMRHLLILIFALLGITATAQQAVPFTSQLQQQVAGQGSVVLIQDEEITTLVNNMPVETTPPASATSTASKTKKPAAKPNSATSGKPTASSSSTSNTSSSSSNSSSATASSTSGKTKPSAYGGQRTRHKVQGYRIQVYSGSGNAQAKKAAKAMEAKVRAAFPELSVYCHFKSPRWICRVGDFATREEAQRYLTKIRNQNISAEASIVSDEVLVVK